MAEQKIESNFSKLSKDVKLLVQGMVLMGSASKRSASSERTITDKGKGVMIDELIQGEKGG